MAFGKIIAFGLNIAKRNIYLRGQILNKQFLPNLSLSQTHICGKYSSKPSEIESLDPGLISHLERTSLVGFGSEEAVARLQEAIKFASVLYEVNTDGVQPMDSVLENETIYLRTDEPAQTHRKDIISNAAITEEDYFVAPPGNIPLEASRLAQDLKKSNV